MKFKINLEEMRNILKFKIKSELLYLDDYNYKRKYLPFLFEGKYGIGKTTSIQQVIEELKEETGYEWGLIKWNLATMSIHEITGIPKIQDNCFTMVRDINIPTQKTIDMKQHHKYGILFLDEINHVDDELKLSSLHSLLQDNILNGVKIPDSWFIVASGNSQEHLGVYHKLPPAVRDRLLIYDVDNSLELQVNYYKSINIHPVILKFINRYAKENKDITQTFDPANENKSDGYIFITRRSIEDVSNTLHQLDEYPNGTDNEKLALICGSVGVRYGAEIFTMYKDSKGKTINNGEEQNIVLNNSTDYSQVSFNPTQINNIEDLVSQVRCLKFVQNNVASSYIGLYKSIISSTVFTELKDINVISSCPELFITKALSRQITTTIMKEVPEDNQKRILEYCTINNISLSSILL